MVTYKLAPLNTLTNTQTMVIRSDGTFIPFAPANTVYQQYLAWLADGNQPETADI